MVRRISEAERSKNIIRVRETRAEYLRLGLCPYCFGASRSEPGREGCRPCRDERNRRYNERRRARLNAGICYKCRGPLDGDGTLCRVCAQKQVSRSARHYERQKAKGVCTWCHRRVAVPGKIWCQECSNRAASRQTAQYRAKQALRPTCPHERWRVALKIADGLLDGRVQVRWRQSCPACRQSEQHTFWALVERLAEVMGAEAP